MWPLTSSAKISTPINSVMALANLFPTFWMNSRTCHLEMRGGDSFCSPKLKPAQFYIRILRRGGTKVSRFSRALRHLEQQNETLGT